MNRPIGIDLFAGAGGLSLGFEQAGFDVAAAVEVDPIHAAIHAFNFPECQVIAKSVEKLTGVEIRDQAGIGNKKISVVFGGAPCQGFSLIGQRALDDPRNKLVREFVRLVSELDSDYFVFENVKGITVGKHKQFLSELISEFQLLGYEVKLPWQVLNASNYGVPQSRERLFLMGCKRGLEVPAYPEAIYQAPGSSLSKSTLPVGPSCKDALEDIPDAEKYKTLLTLDAVKAALGEPSAYAKMMRGLIAASDDYSYRRNWNKDILTSSLRSSHTQVSRVRFKKTKMGEVEPISRFFKLPENGVSNTLRAGTDSARGAFTSPRPIHYKYARCVTVREMARLHGFPDWFRFHKTKWHGARQIGNAVPPPLGKAVGAQIMKAAGITPVRSSRLLEMGDERFLNFDMREASSFFSISSPIGKRDRKGVARPRQQQVETV